MFDTILITLLDGEVLKITDETHLVTYINNSNDSGYDSVTDFNNIISRVDNANFSSPMRGIMGILINSSFFSLAEDIDSNEIKIYKTSAIKSLSFEK
ncbi:hypothetical protein [Carnobacterium maltaromaticum]|uniref:hypothetical protein n=1 Tax=Carnobacterium maltaromaticum TaxID=2751 RepID=UPI0039BEC478